MASAVKSHHDLAWINLFSFTTLKPLGPGEGGTPDGCLIKDVKANFSCVFLLILILMSGFASWRRVAVIGSNQGSTFTSGRAVAEVGFAKNSPYLYTKGSVRCEKDLVFS